MTRQQVEIWAKENDEPLVLLDGLDLAIEGIISEGLKNPKVVYSKEKTLRALRLQGMNKTEALEWFDYNILRALPYMGKYAPVFLTRVY